MQVYATQHGRPLGSFGAHDDAVSCVLAPPAADHIISASWDCSVKTWRCSPGLNCPAEACMLVSFRGDCCDYDVMPCEMGIQNAILDIRLPIMTEIYCNPQGLEHGIC